ncbi:unnamed protein product [Dovyalis caffra]|uniref:Uncharacterized protein n=1 Tax=Dovyalis caffra TaxID=77055 RepID=A0AAV1S5X5_9ROSI|nr:unnamed protein product [Dovyalis caffra]
MEKNQTSLILTVSHNRIDHSSNLKKKTLSNNEILRTVWVSDKRACFVVGHSWFCDTARRKPSNFESQNRLQPLLLALLIEQRYVGKGVLHILSELSYLPRKEFNEINTNK